MTAATRTFSLSDFDFALPPELIAQHPAPERSASRLLDGRAATPVDRVFRELPGLLRAGDLVARIGGEEFLIALPNIALPEARLIAERLCTVMAEHPFHLNATQDLPVTLSIGLAISEAGELPAHVETVTDIFDRADRALLRAKTAGRTQVTISRAAA